MLFLLQNNLQITQITLSSKVRIVIDSYWKLAVSIGGRNDQMYISPNFTMGLLMLFGIYCLYS